MTDGIINIHGKDYMTVAKRVELAHKDGIDSIETEVIQHAPVVVVRAIVKVKGKSYTGISSANPAKAIEKSNPYEVAETSAVGRALGFANYGIIEGIASADEMNKAANYGGNATYNNVSPSTHTENGNLPERQINDEHFCDIHKKPMKERTSTQGGTWYDHRWKVGDEWQQCNGKPKPVKIEKFEDDMPEFKDY